MRAAAIIVAAGASRRFKGAVPKQFTRLRGIPVYLWSVLAFRKIKDIKQVILVVPGSRINSFKNIAVKFGLDVARGGPERVDSVRAGLSAVRQDIDIVAIHDGARPLITSGVIKSSLASAKKYGSAVVSVRARDTVKSSPGKFVRKTIPRNTIWFAQTPQTFRKKIIEKAYAKLKTKNITDDAQAAELAGYKVAIVPGLYSNIKITDKLDLEVAKILITDHC
jgi:2-C-methyl-D-erythritol 4-phosphate cytidylyltransferase